MFTSGSHRYESFSKHRAGKVSSSKKRASFRAGSAASARLEQAAEQLAAGQQQQSPNSNISPSLTSAIITVVVGREQRLFAAHEDVLCNSPYFAHLIRAQFFSSQKAITLPDDEPEILSSVLEFLYKGDYAPRLEFDKRRHSWGLEQVPGVGVESTVFVPATNGAGVAVLKDTVLYCAALKYQLPELARLALRKQGLQSGIQCSTILSSARYAYANTPDTDSKLRAHYLALIIRSRSTFRRSGTMQAEMEHGGKLFFDLFVAMCNHMDDMHGTPRSTR